MDANGQTRILRRLDDPWKLGLWELDVALPFAVCLMFGLLRGSAVALVAGIAVGFFISQRVSKIKASGHPRHFRHLMYWALPPSAALAPKAFPPSGQREMVG